MRRSVAGFVLGLIGGIGIFIISTPSIIGSAAISDLGLADTETTLFLVLSWLMFIGSILAIIGASLCFKKARIGGILLLISAITALAHVGFTIYQVAQVALVSSTITLLIFQAIPAILIIVASIIALSAKPREIEAK